MNLMDQMIATERRIRNLRRSLTCGSEESRESARNELTELQGQWDTLNREWVKANTPRDETPAWTGQDNQF